MTRTVKFIERDGTCYTGECDVEFKAEAWADVVDVNADVTPRAGWARSRPSTAALRKRLATATSRTERMQVWQWLRYRRRARLIG